MSEHTAKISWAKQGAFSHEGFDRAHVGEFYPDCKVSMAGANNGSLADPEQMFAVSLASCHMQTFLLLAAKKRLVVESYEDTATAVLAKNEEGLFFIESTRLNPVTVFSADTPVSAEALRKMHDKAHHHCFIANSISCPVEIKLEF